MTIDFTGCKALGIVNAHSLGDPAEIILSHAKATLCIVTITPLDVGLRLAIDPIHIEVAGKLLEVLGTVIGLITPDPEQAP